MHAFRSAPAAGLVLSLVLAGCSGAAAPSPSPSSAPPTQAAPTQVPGGLASPSSSVIVDPAPGGGGGADPGNPAGDFVIPQPGTTIDPRPVAIEQLDVRVEGRHVTVVATWTSGVEPCYTLDTVAVKQDGNEFTISLTEGSADADAFCIEIAKTKSTLVDLGDLAPGEYVVAAQEETAPAVRFTVS